MKPLAIIFGLSATLLLCGCGGGAGPTQRFSSSTPPTSTPPTTAQTPSIAGNWQFSAASTIPGEASLMFAGGISQADTAVSGALHVDGSNCFDRLTTMGLTGTVTSDSASLTSTAIDGQVVTLIGNFTDATFIGTYRINGGCAAGEQGRVTGINIPYIDNQLSGTFTNSARKIFNVTGSITQSGSASPEGSFEISGTATFDTPCFTAGTIITPETFPSGSFILGMSLALEFETSNGILTFLGTLNRDRSEISGNYTVSGGTCDDNGTALLRLSSASPWDY